MNIGIIGAGWIAEKMASTISKLDGIKTYAIASRDIEKAKTYAAKYGVTKAYGSSELRRILATYMWDRGYDTARDRLL